MSLLRPTFKLHSAVVTQQQPPSKIREVRDIVLKLVDQASNRHEQQLGFFQRLTSYGKNSIKSSIVYAHRRGNLLEHTSLDKLEADLIRLAGMGNPFLSSARLSEGQLQLIVKMATHDDAVFRSRIRDQAKTLLWSGVVSSRVIHISDFDQDNPQHISALRYRTVELEAYFAVMNLHQGAQIYVQQCISANSEYKSISINGEATLAERLSKYLDPHHRVHTYVPDHRGLAVMVFDGIAQQLRRNS